MGILRADRVSGLGGANAIKGSVFFNKQPSSFLRTEIDDTDFVLGTDDFTLELWHNTPTLSTTNGLIMFGPGGYGYYNSFFHFSTADVVMYISSNGSSWDIAQGTKIGERKVDTWHHFALTREGNTFRGFVDGVLGATFTSSGSIRQGSSEFNKNQIIIGHRITTTLGHISNFRYIKGRAVYTAAFTPPSYELNVTPDTILLCCQSPSNVLQEATGKTLILEAGGSSNAVSAAENVGPPVATRFTPNSPVGFSTTTDVGTQFGSTFDGVTTFDSQAYMVPPGGNTRERNRGRAIFAGGVASPYKEIQVVDISSGGIAQDFGETTTAAPNNGSASSSTRMLVTSGGTPAPINTIEFITIADIASSTDFGDLTEPRRRTQSLSNSTRAVHVGGTSASPASLYRNEIDFNTIATAGNSTDFGDTLAAHVATGGSVASSTRGVYSVGYLNGSYVNTLEFITIATTGNGQDFGDLNGGTIGYHHRGSTCDSTRGLFSGGYNPLAQVQNKIDFITIASTGNATDFGDLSVARRSGAGTANSIHSIFAGGYLPGVSNTIDRVVIQTTGNAKDFGDFVVKTHENSGSSDSHGGLS